MTARPGRGAGGAGGVVRRPCDAETAAPKYRRSGQAARIGPSGSPLSPYEAEAREPDAEQRQRRRFWHLGDANCQIIDSYNAATRWRVANCDMNGSDRLHIVGNAKETRACGKQEVLCRKIAKSYEGRVWASGATRKGVRFDIKANAKHAVCIAQRCGLKG